jgi:hypothetical protein
MVAMYIRAGAWLGLAVIALTAVVYQPVASQAQAALPTITPADDNTRKLNLVSQLAMLSQYLPRSLCFSLLRPNAPQPNEIGFASELFNQTLDDLRKGSEIQEILPVTEPDIRAALDRTALIWKDFAAAVAARDAAAAVKLDPELLATAQSALQLLEARNKATGVKPGIAAALRFGGVQRMLTQKASKEFCLVAADRDAGANKQRLAATVAQIDGALRLLLNVDGPDTGEIADQLATVEKRWAGLRAVLLRATEGASPTPEDVNAVALSNVAVMTAFSRLVEIYELAE